jgi:putative ABC transport system substrate-binding protein
LDRCAAAACDRYFLQPARAAARHRLPALHELCEFAEGGGLVSYGTNLADAYRFAHSQGREAGHLSIQQSTKIELAINIKAATALGLDVPLHFQQLADEVID